MKPSFAILILSIAQIGCGSSYNVSSSTMGERLSFSEFNAVAKNQDAKLVFQDDSTLYVQGVLAQRDSVSWLHPMTHTRVAAPTQKVKKIVLKNSGLGLLEGAGIGALAGGGGGLIVGAIWSGSVEGSLPKAATRVLPPLIGTGAGLFIGAITGLVLGHTYEYEFLQEIDKP